MSKQNKGKGGDEPACPQGRKKKKKEEEKIEARQEGRREEGDAGIRVKRGPWA